MKKMCIIAARYFLHIPSFPGLHSFRLIVVINFDSFESREERK